VGITEPLNSAEPLHDIRTREDCELLVRTFYGRALTDPVIGWLFTDVAKLDLEAHVPRITNFWETILLGAHSYGGGAFRPHIELNAKTPLKRGHFDRWLHLWRDTVDGLFSGDHAELAKAHATRVAGAFESRLRSAERQPFEFAPGIPAGPESSTELKAPELPLVHHHRQHHEPDPGE
jgi:hemoglobin